MGRKSARRTSERAVSLNTRRLLSTRLSRSVELLLSRTVMSRDLRSVELNTSLSAGPSKRFMMLRMMLLSAELKLRRNVRMRHLVTPPTPSAPSGPRRCAVFPRSKSRSTPQSPDVPRSQESCAPAGCGFKQGAEECYDKTQTVVQDAPKEQCSLEPQRTCKHVTKLVPKLTPTEECVDVPKEVCTRSRTNPRKVKKHVLKKWCYVPSEESGLA